MGEEEKSAGEGLSYKVLSRVKEGGVLRATGLLAMETGIWISSSRGGYNFTQKHIT